MSLTITYTGPLPKITRLRRAFDTLAHPTLLQPRNFVGGCVWELRVENATQAFCDTACEHAAFFSNEDHANETPD